MNGSSPRTGVAAEIRRSGSLVRTDMFGPEITMAAIESLLPLTTYNFTMFVVTDVGRSRPSVISVSTLSLSM